MKSYFSISRFLSPNSQNIYMNLDCIQLKTPQTLNSSLIKLILYSLHCIVISSDTGPGRPRLSTRARASALIIYYGIVRNYYRSGARRREII